MIKDRILPLIAIMVSLVAIGIALYCSIHLEWDAVLRFTGLIDRLCG